MPQFLLGLAAGLLVAGAIFLLLPRKVTAAPAPQPSQKRQATPAPKPAPKSPRVEDWQDYISTYQFPAGVIDKALTRCPKGTSRLDIERGLRQFFLACGSVKTFAAAMPSKTVDEAWHEFITYTRDYAEFCDKAFGKFLHHVPETTMTANELDTNNGSGMVTSWIVACHDEGLDIFGETAPTLFAADARATGGRLRRAAKAPAYLGSCGPDTPHAAATTPCTRSVNTICMAHAYADAWSALADDVTKARKQSTAARATSSNQSITSVHGYDSATMVALMPVLIASEPTPGPAATSGGDTEPVKVPAYSSCGSAPVTSCGSAPASSCGSASSGSSCGGGGGCGSV